jgi:nitrogen fixation protein NifU and related proteins
MLDLHDLYQEVIIDHNRAPRNYRCMHDANKMAEGENPLCGDEISLYLKVVDDKISEICFQGKGCAISTASASLMTECLTGKSLVEAQALFTKMHVLLTHGSTSTASEGLGKLTVLAGVCDYPARVKCASLAWHTLNAALAGQMQPVSTEE